MNSAQGAVRRLLPSDLLLLALIVAIPIMKPAVSGEVIVADLLFVILGLALAIELVTGLRRLTWMPDYWPLLAYVAALGCSLLATSDARVSLFKLATEFYLLGLVAVAAWLIDSEATFRRAVLAWLGVTALVSLVGILGLLAFATGLAGWLLDYSSFGFGSLPPGDYPRLALTFFNANMACNYLTAGLALTFLARSLGYIGRSAYWLLLAGIGVASLSTVSPGLGGVALIASLWIWVISRARSPWLARAALACGSLVALLFVIALALTPFPHSTATFEIRLPGNLALYPAPRLLIWTAALKQFAGHPLLGIGLGIDPVHVGFASPSGYEVLTDAHEIFLSIAAQCGILGLIGLAAIIQLVIARTPLPRATGRATLPRFLLGAAFLDVFVYQGLGGSFEDTRHIWMLLGLIIAAGRIDFSREDESSRTAGAPSPC
jgi:O-antigen ligase